MVRVRRDRTGVLVVGKGGASGATVLRTRYGWVGMAATNCDTEYYLDILYRCF